MANSLFVFLLVSSVDPLGDEGHSRRLSRVESRLTERRRIVSIRHLEVSRLASRECAQVEETVRCTPAARRDPDRAIRVSGSDRVTQDALNDAPQAMKHRTLEP